MPKFYGQNKKRIDPRYFLEETMDRDVDIGALSDEDLKVMPYEDLKALWATQSRKPSYLPADYDKNAADLDRIVRALELKGWEHPSLPQDGDGRPMLDTLAGLSDKPGTGLEETKYRDSLAAKSPDDLMAMAGDILLKAGDDGPVVAVDKGIITSDEYAMLQQIRKVLGFGVQSYSDVDPDRAEFGAPGQHGLGPGYTPEPL